MAAGDTLSIWTAVAGIPPATNYATLDLRNAQPCLDFDAATEESIYFEGLLPRNYGGGGVTLAITWAASTATSGGVVWGVSFERHQDDAHDLDTDGFASEKTVADTAASASGELSYPTIAFTNGAEMDSLAAGESFRIKIARKVGNASDDMTGDAEITRVHLYETP